MFKNDKVFLSVFIPNATNQYSVEWLRNFLPPGKDLEPFGRFDYPILPNAADAVPHRHHEYDNKTREAVAIFDVVFFWRDLFTNILPAGSKGIVVVLKNSCGNGFTYQIVSFLYS